MLRFPFHLSQFKQFQTSTKYKYSLFIYIFCGTPWVCIFSVLIALAAWPQLTMFSEDHCLKLLYSVADQLFPAFFLPFWNTLQNVFLFIFMTLASCTSFYTHFVPSVLSTNTYLYLSVPGLICPSPDFLPVLPPVIQPQKPFPVFDPQHLHSL